MSNLTTKQFNQLIADKTIIVISGSRSINNYWEFSKWLRFHLEDFHRENVVIIQGESFFGVDRLARLFAKRNGYTQVGFPANWNAPDPKMRRIAGMVRNSEMLQYADILFAVHDGVSTGTKNAIDTFLRKKQHVRILHLKPTPNIDDYKVKKIMKVRQFGDHAKSDLLYVNRGDHNGQE